MKIAILSRDSTLYSCRRLKTAAEGRGHQVEIIDPTYCSININPLASSIHYRGQPLGYYDAVIPRIGSTRVFHSITILCQFELLGSYALNPSSAITRARDKLHTLQLLAQQGIDSPITGFAHSADDTLALIEHVGGAPLVVKLLEGTQGIGVVLAESRQAAESVIDAFRALDTPILVQEYIAEAKGADIRCFVIGGRVVASIERQAKDGEFRSNIHRGGSARKVEISDVERKIALQATAALGLNVAGVDILRSKRGPLVMEINGSPGLEGVEQTTGIDISGMIITFIEEQGRTDIPLKYYFG